MNCRGEILNILIFMRVRDPQEEETKKINGHIIGYCESFRYGLARRAHNETKSN